MKSSVLWCLFFLVFLAISALAGCDDAGSACNLGQTPCGGDCVDTASDRENCGACGTTCMPGQYCAAGRCLPCQNECMLGEKQCAPGAANQVQSCGDPDGDTCFEWAPAETCAAGQVCANAQCQTSCQDECSREGAQTCDAIENGYHVCGEFDQDDCMDLGALVPCGANQTCSDGQCGAGCADECTQSGQIACAEPPQNGVVSCGNYDADGCLEWGNFVGCAGGQTCSAGACSSSCQDDCASGERICDGVINGYRTCGSFDPDACLDWSSVVECASWESCAGGQCQASCSDECQTGQRQCSGSDGAGDEGFDLCADFDADGCLEFGGHTLCSASENCENGNCVEGCQDECDTTGQRVCQGLAGYITCGNHDADTCLEFSPTVTECPAGEQCFNGACSATCQSECSAGQKQCFGTGYQNCEQYSGDPTCWVWSAVIPCQTWYVCDDTSVTCVLGCSEDCPQVGETRCSADLGGTQTCVTNADGDPCREWAATVACPTNYTCDQGSGQCELGCQDECFSSGARQCTADGSGYDVCLDHDTDGCLEWGGTTGCPSGESCSGGVCSATCSDECDTLNEIVCDAVDPQTFRLCVNSDADVCLELSTSDTCDYDEECQTGSGCVQICTNECSLPGDRRCQAGRVESCAADHDGDGCLEWGLLNDCVASGQLCYNGACVASSPPTTILVNEILYDSVGVETAQDNWLFIELYGLAGQSLTNFSVVGVQGATSQPADYVTIPLDGYQIPANGHFVIAHHAGHPDLLAVADLVTSNSAADLQNGPDSVQVRWAGSVVVDALGYDNKTAPFTADDRWAGEGASYADAAPAAGTVGDVMYCLSRDAVHTDTNVNIDDFWLRAFGNCSPGWAGPGAVVGGPSLVFGGNSTPAIDNNGHVWTVDEDGWINVTYPDFTTDYFSPGTRVFQSSVAVDYGAPGQYLFYVGSNTGLYAYLASEDSAAPYDAAINSVSGFPVQTGQSIYSTPAIGPFDGAVFFGTRSGGFFGYEPDGTLRFSYSTSGAAVDGSPAITQLASGDEVVVFGTGAGTVVALRTEGASAGTAVWTRSDAFDACHSSPAVGEGRVFVSCDDGFLYGYALETGAPLAGFPVDLTAGGVEWAVDGCSPVYMPDVGLGYAQIAACSRSEAGNFWGLHYDGATVTGWYYDLDGLVSTPAFGADGSITVHADNYLFNVDSAGDMQWYAAVGSATPADDWVLSSPTWLNSGQILVVDPTSSGGRIYAVQASTGPATFGGAYPMFHGDMHNSGEGW